MDDDDPFIQTTDDLLALLDSLLAARGGDWWDGFYGDRAKPCPFFVDAPDESLAGWVQAGLVRPGKALDLGCGNGRNAIFLARQGFAVDAVDHAPKAIAWAAERARAAGVVVQLHCQSVFDLACEAGSYDLVYDAGCFHHLPPHRRGPYVDLIYRALKPGGWFGLACFRPEGGSGHSDLQVYQQRSLGGGLGYTEARLRQLWSRPGLQLHTLRRMQQLPSGQGLFGQEFLWALLAHKPADAPGPAAAALSA